MTDDIRALTARLADEPSSLAFLELGEALRRRGQLDAAYKVVRGGLSRYPGLADAHDLLGRILGDQGDLAGAFDAWADALRFDPMRSGALKGIGFLYFRAGNVEAALEHLQRAADIDPDDLSIAQALARVRAAERATPVPPQAEPAADTIAPAPAMDTTTDGATASTSLFAGPENSDQGVMLVDGNGLRLSGSLRSPTNEDVGDRVAAELAGVSKEASRTAKLLGLGAWVAIAVESPEGNLFLLPPTPQTLLLTVRDSSLPMARLGLIAERAARDARAWLGVHE
ncbi:MAG: tetratricopeptide repeat protein [Gemmatimonadales bacterium]|nr:tetratricopeptide repeat protein [Gemmatimonadales bacterium]